MAKRKVSKQTKKKRKPRKDDNLKTNLKRTVAGLFTLIVLVVLAGFFAHHFILRKQPVQTIIEPPMAPAPRFEIYPEKIARTCSVVKSVMPTSE